MGLGKRREMLDGYHIVNEGDVAQALQEREHYGRLAASSRASKKSPANVS